MQGGMTVDQAKFDVIREAAKARKSAREAAEAASIAVWPEKYAAMVMRAGGPADYFGPLTDISVEDLSADQSSQDAITKPA